MRYLFIILLLTGCYQSKIDVEAEVKIIENNSHELKRQIDSMEFAGKMQVERLRRKLNK